MIHHYQVFARVVLLGGLVSLLPGCGSFLSGAASMRIEVDVYKGPLSNTTSIQKGQLKSIIYSANFAINDVDEQLERSMCLLNCMGSPKSKPNAEAEDILANINRSIEVTDTIHHRIKASKCKEMGITTPESYSENLYKVCPIYGRIRSQLGILKKLSKLPSIEDSNDPVKKQIKRNGEMLEFTREINRARSILEIENSVLAQIAHYRRTACGTPISITEPGTCKTTLDEYLEKIQSLAAKIKELPESAPFDEDPLADFGIGLNSYLALVEQVGRQSRSLVSASDEVDASLESTHRQLTQKAELSKLSDGLKTTITNIGSYQLHPLSTAHIESRFNAVAMLPDPASLSFNNFSAWRNRIAGLKEGVDDFSKNQDRRNDEIKKIKRQLDDASRGSLKIYLAGRAPSIPALTATHDRAEKLSNHLSLIRELIDHRSNGLAKQAKTIHGFLTSQVSRKATFEKYRARPTLSADTNTAADTQLNQLNTLKQALQEVEKSHRVVMKTDWGSTHDDLLSIKNHLAAALDNLNKIIAAKTWDVAGSDVNELTELQTALTGLRGASFPREFITDEKRGLLLEQLKKINQAILGVGGKGSLATRVGANGFEKDLSLVTVELNNYRSGIAADTLSTDDGLKLSAINKLKQTLSEQNARLGTTGSAIKKALDFASHQQRANELAAYQQISTLAASFRVLATAISYQLTSIAPIEHRLRIDMVKTANMAAEFSNQLTSRANALSLQADGLERERISTGQYLRDTQPTAFLDAFHWLDAGTTGKLSIEQRTNISKRLFADDNWARVNQVYASGVGTTAMAFIKDEIGNWNLKSFENDPGKLTRAYTDLGLKLLESAAAAASGGATAIASASKVASLTNAAQDIQSGNRSEGQDLRAGETIKNLDLQGFRNELAQNLIDIKSGFEKAKTEIEGKTRCDQLPVEWQQRVETITGDDVTTIIKGCPADNPLPPTLTAQADIGVAPPAVVNNSDTTTAAQATDETVAQPDDVEPTDNLDEVIPQFHGESIRQAAAEAREKSVVVIQRYFDLIDSLQRVAAIDPKLDDN